MAKRDTAKIRHPRQQNKSNRLCRAASRTHIHSAIEGQPTDGLSRYFRRMGIGKRQLGVHSNLDLDSFNKSVSSGTERLDAELKQTTMDSLTDKVLRGDDRFELGEITVEDIVKVIGSIKSRVAGSDGIGSDMIEPIKNLVISCQYIELFSNIFLLACSMAVSAAQRVGVTADITESQKRSGGYGLLRPGYNTGLQSGYGGYPGNIGYPGPNTGFGGYGNGGYGGGGYGTGGYGSGGYGPGNFGGNQYSPGYGGQNYPGFGGGYRPYRPGFDRPGYYPGSIGAGSVGIGNPGYNRPGYSPYRPGYDRPIPGNSGNYFGGYNDGYNDSFRRLERKAGETKKEE
ncbi:uncharacterized protein ACR2FA_000294 [Aphomia sociella]